MGLRHSHVPALLCHLLAAVPLSWGHSCIRRSTGHDWQRREQYRQTENTDFAHTFQHYQCSSDGELDATGSEKLQITAVTRSVWRARDYGSLTGTPIDSEDTFAFSVLENFRPMIETFPLQQAADACARMMQGKARFRVVLVTKDGVA
jgi:hypothetical protein